MAINNKINKNVSLVPTIEFSIRKMMSEQTIRNAFHMGSLSYFLVPVALLNVKKYQRAITDRKHLIDIAVNWDDKKCKPLTISYEEEKGWFNVVDGQHRALAAKMRGIEFVPCEIHFNLTESEEAKMFVELNTNAKKPKPVDTFNANQYISGKDETAESALDKRLYNLFSELNITVGSRNNGNGCWTSIKHGRRILKDSGDDCIRFIVHVVQDSGLDQCKDCYSYKVIESLRRVYNKYHEMEKLDIAYKNLVSRLTGKSTDYIQGLADNMFSGEKIYPKWFSIIDYIAA